MSAARIAGFDVRPDEVGCFTEAERELGVSVELHERPLGPDNLPDVDGVDAVSILGATRIDAEMCQELGRRGIRFLATRTVGFDHIDLAAARENGIRVSHVEYPADSVAEYTVMLLLMSLRKMKLVLHRAEIQDYSLEGSVGREVNQITVGIIGAGRIGGSVARLLKPFGCRLLAYDKYPNDALRGTVEFVDYDTLIRESDALTLHAPALPENHHMLGAEQFAMMRNGVVIINCGRGDLMDTDALIAGVESGKVAGAALDVLENDLKYFHRDFRLGVIRNRDLALLRAFPNVIVTPHIAFYTDRVVAEMVLSSVRSLASFLDGDDVRLEVTAA